MPNTNVQRKREESQRWLDSNRTLFEKRATGVVEARDLTSGICIYQGGRGVWLAAYGSTADLQELLLVLQQFINTPRRKPDREVTFRALQPPHPSAGPGCDKDLGLLDRHARRDHLVRGRALDEAAVLIDARILSGSREHQQPWRGGGSSWFKRLAVEVLSDPFRQSGICVAQEEREIRLVVYGATADLEEMLLVLQAFVKLPQNEDDQELIYQAVAKDKLGARSD